MMLILVVFSLVLQACFAAKYIDSDPILFQSQVPSARIIGGDDAADGAAPFQCSLQLNKTHLCGCAIISSEWIVTAQHCCRWLKPVDLQIYVGSNDLKGNGTYYNVEKCIVHENYDEPLFSHDFAVVRVQGSIALNDKVQPIEYSSEEVPDGVVAQLTGWGRLTTRSMDYVPAQHLQIIKLDVIQTKRCKKLLYYAHASHICTDRKNGQGFSDGDSGSPLVYNNKLIGIVGWTFPVEGFPDPYVKIAYVYDWIRSKTESN